MSMLEAPANGETRSPTAERILDVAETLFAERGFAGVAVRDIAAGVKLNPASLYNHFLSKQELYEAVLDRGLQPIVELLRALSESKGSEEPDFEPLDAVVDYVATKPGLARILQYEVLSGGENIQRLAGRWLAPIYERGIDVLKTNPGSASWEPEDLPLLIAAFHNIIVGYFSTAPLRERILGEDPLSSDALVRQKRFLREVARRLLTVS